MYPNDIKTILAHEDFDEKTRKNDIGMILFYYDVPTKFLSIFFQI